MKDWLDKLAETPRHANEEPPKGYLSSREIAKRLGFAKSGAVGWIAKETKAGRIKRVNVRRLRCNGRPSIVPYYGPA